MTTLDEILAPITPTEVFADYHDRKPLYVPAEAQGSPETRSRVETTRGPVMHEIRMKPGDRLYPPHGWRHDALVVGGAVRAAASARVV